MTAPCGRPVAAGPGRRRRPRQRSLSLRRRAQATPSPELAIEAPHKRVSRRRRRRLLVSATRRSLAERPAASVVLSPRHWISKRSPRHAVAWPAKRSSDAASRSPLRFVLLESDARADAGARSPTRATALTGSCAGEIRRLASASSSAARPGEGAVERSDHARRRRHDGGARGRLPLCGRAGARRASVEN
jgi:hypothetical protein